MQTVQKVGIGVLIGMSFVTGLSFRTHTDQQNQTAAAQLQREAEVAPGTRVAAAGMEGAANVNFHPVQTLYLVLTRVREYYVEQLTDKTESEMTYDAIKVMLASLKDVNTRFLEREEVSALKDAQTGKFHGIGAMLGIRRSTSGEITEEQLVVVSPVIGGPAAAKLQSGDVIAAVDGKIVLPFDPFQRVNKMIKDGRKVNTPTSELRKTVDAEQKRIENGMSIVDAQKLLNTRDDKTVELTIRRAGEAKPLKIKIDQKAFQVEPVEYKLPGDDGLAYIRINCFCARTAGQFAEAMKAIEGAGAKGLTLDVRNVSGGELSAALEVAKFFAPKQSLAYLIKAQGKRSPVTIPSVPEAQKWEGPLAVMVNAGTARTPEVLASALKNSAQAKLVGSKTYGDSTYTTLYGLDDGSGVVMTTGKFLTNKSEDFTAKGLSVDFKIASDLSNDAQLKEAAKLLANGGNGS